MMLRGTRLPRRELEGQNLQCRLLFYAVDQGVSGAQVLLRICRTRTHPVDSLWLEVMLLILLDIILTPYASHMALALCEHVPELMRVGKDELFGLGRALSEEEPVPVAKSLV